MKNQSSSPIADSPIDSPIDPVGSRGTMSRTSSGTSGRLRSASLRFLESSPPLGAWYATGEALGRAPTHGDIRKGSFSHVGWDAAIQRRNSSVASGKVASPAAARNASSISPIRGSAAGSGPIGLDTHPEIEHENDIFPTYSSRGEMSNQMFTPRSSRHTPKTVDDDDDNEDVAPDQDRPLPKKFQEPPPVATKVGATSTTAPTVGTTSQASSYQGPNADGVYPNGYKFPPKLTRTEALKIGFIGFCKYTITPLGFIVVIYCLNIVAWGGMLFLLLVGGGNQYMCYPARLHGIKDCNDLYSPRRIWLEIDSQILNALFCVTGLGLIPWRFRDLYYLLQYRLFHNISGLRKLGGIHNGWFRLPGSDKLPTPLKPTSSPLVDVEARNENNPSLPLPKSKIPEGPLTGIRAPATAVWKLDYVVWAFVLNTFLQCVLCGFMWGYNRFHRPSWATGTFIALACIVAGLGGLMTFQEAKKVKAVEGISPEVNRVVRDIEKGVEGKKLNKEKM